MLGDETRKCTKCHHEKPLSEFYQEAWRPDGYRTDCKVCHAARVNARLVEKWRTDPQFRARTLAQQAEYSKNPLVLERRRVWFARRYATDPHFALNSSFSREIRHSLADGKGGKPWESLVGYGLDDLVAHLEARFTDGMTWDNHGSWHIDHIIPKTAFTYETAEDPGFIVCWSLPNLRPLWGEDNLAKSSHMPAADEIPDELRTLLALFYIRFDEL